MRSQRTRRDFLRQSLTVGVTASVSPFLLVEQAQAGVPTALAYLGFATLWGGAGAALLFILELVETAASAAQGAERDAMLSEVASQLVEISSKQDDILELLGQLDVVIDQALDRHDLKNDVIRLLEVAKRYQIALLDDPAQRTESLRETALLAGDLTVRFPTYGVPAASAYVAAIALENGIHYKLDSPQSKFHLINAPHRQHLQEMLNGDGPRSLGALVSRLKTAASRDPAARRVSADVGYRFPLVEVASLADRRAGLLVTRGCRYEGIGDDSNVRFVPYLTSSDWTQSGAVRYRDVKDGRSLLLLHGWNNGVHSVSDALVSSGDADAAAEQLFEKECDRLRDEYQANFDWYQRLPADVHQLLEQALAGVEKILDSKTDAAGPQT